MWVARNEDGKYHLFDEKPHYDSWWRKWVIGNPYDRNDELTIKYIETLYERVTPAALGFEMDYTDEPVEVDVKTLITLKHPNKQRKERTAKDRPINKYLEDHQYSEKWNGTHCDYFDDLISLPSGDTIGRTECNAPWAIHCKGNKLNCNKLKMKWLSSLSEEKRTEWIKEHEN